MGRVGRTHRLTSTYEAVSASASALGFTLKNAALRGPLGRRFWRAPAGLVSHDIPASLYSGNPARGEAWLAGNYTLAGGIVHNAGKIPFLHTPPSQQWHDQLHSFEWLRDVLAAPNGAGTATAREMILHWAQSDYINRKRFMQPAIIARRLINWGFALRVLKTSFDSQEMALINTSYTHQARWLALTVHQAPDGLARLYAVIGLTLAGLSIAQEGHILRHGMDLLMRELRRQIFPDGGHMSRAPDVIVRLLADLIAIESGLTARQIAPPAAFTLTLTRMQAMVVMLRHRDGKLAVFHGGLECEPAAIAAVLPKRPPAPMSFSQKSGYQRLSADKTCIVMDVGNAATGAHSQTAHAAPLAFEMSHGNDRLIVNCGPNLVHGAEWQLAARGLSAHSTLAFEKGVKDPFTRHGFAAKRLGARLIPDDWQVTSRRVEDKSGIWLETSHAGFVESHGVRHNRRLFIDARGEDVRGEDFLLADATHPIATGAAFHLRFHLHPNIHASLQGTGNTALLVTPGGHGWQFRVGQDGDAHLAIEESVYMGRNGVPQRTQQLAIRAHLGHTDTLIRWALRYAGRSGRKRPND